MFSGHVLLMSGQIVFRLKKMLKLALGGVVSLLCTITQVFLSCLSSFKLMDLKELSGDVMQGEIKSASRAGSWEGKRNRRYIEEIIVVELRFESRMCFTTWMRNAED